MASTLISNIKTRMKNSIPDWLIDKFMNWRLSPKKYQEFRIALYEKTYDGSIIKLGNHHYRLHQHESVSRMLFADKIFSGDVVEFLRHILPHFGSFLDIGANIGSISVPTMSYQPLPSLAVEPVTNNYKLLLENLKINGLEEKVKTLQAAVGAEDGSTRIYLSPNNSGDHRINRKEHENREFEEVHLYTLDKCLREFTHLKPPYLIKVDVQGYETQVIRGSQFLAQSPCAFVIELWPWGLETNGSSVQELEASYQTLGLQAYVLHFEKSGLKIEKVKELQPIADKIPTDWGAHLELLITNLPLEKLGLSTLLI